MQEASIFWLRTAAVLYSVGVPAWYKHFEVVLYQAETRFQ
jgi:hypothetical protein